MYIDFEPRDSSVVCMRNPKSGSLCITEYINKLTEGFYNFKAISN